MNREELDGACEWLEENTHRYIYDSEGRRYKHPRFAIGGKCWENFRKAMDYYIDTETSKQLSEEVTREIVKQINPLFEKCLASVNPDTRNEVRKNMNLTWEDIRKIIDIYQRTAKLTKDGEVRKQEDVFKEVLSKFKEESK